MAVSDDLDAQPVPVDQARRAPADGVRPDHRPPGGQPSSQSSCPWLQGGRGADRDPPVGDRLRLAHRPLPRGPAPGLPIAVHAVGAPRDRAGRRGIVDGCSTRRPARCALRGRRRRRQDVDDAGEGTQRPGAPPLGGVGGPAIPVLAFVVALVWFIHGLLWWACVEALVVLFGAMGRPAGRPAGVAGDSAAAPGADPAGRRRRGRTAGDAGLMRKDAVIEFPGSDRQGRARGGWRGSTFRTATPRPT